MKHPRITTLAAAGVLAVAIPAGMAVMASGAGASSPTLSTTSRTETLVSPRCFHYHQVTKTYEHWSTAAGRYIPYTPAPRVTITDYTQCHK